MEQTFRIEGFKKKKNNIILSVSSVQLACVVHRWPITPLIGKSDQLSDNRII